MTWLLSAALRPSLATGLPAARSALTPTLAAARRPALTSLTAGSSAQTAFILLGQWLAWVILWVQPRGAALSLVVPLVRHGRFL